MKGMLSVWISIFAIIALVDCEEEALTYPTQSVVSAEALKVYGVALDSLHVQQDQDMIYILDSTIVVFSFAMRSYEYIKRGYPEFEQETYASLLANNYRRCAIPSLPPHIHSDYHLVFSNQILYITINSKSTF